MLRFGLPEDRSEDRFGLPEDESVFRKKSKLFWKTGLPEDQTIFRKTETDPTRLMHERELFGGRVRVERLRDEPVMRGRRARSVGAFLGSRCGRGDDEIDCVL